MRGEQVARPAPPIGSLSRSLAQVRDVSLNDDKFGSSLVCHQVRREAVKQPQDRTQVAVEATQVPLQGKVLLLQSLRSWATECPQRCCPAK